MKLTGRRSVIVDQLPDGSIIIKPAKSILHLAGSLKAKRSLLAPEEERREVHAAMAREIASKLRRR
jgi:hypothetical protein